MDQVHLRQGLARLAASISRRTALAAVVGAAAGWSTTAEAKKKKKSKANKKKNRPAPPPPPPQTCQPDCGGKGCGSNGCDGVCGTCDSGETCEAGQCVAERAYVFEREWGHTGFQDGSFSGPRTIALDADANVYVADTGNHRIQKFSSSGQHLFTWGHYAVGENGGHGQGEFSRPNGVGVSHDGSMYVADTENARVQKFSSSGEFVLEWPVDEAHFPRNYRPMGVATDAAGNVYVTTAVGLGVLKFTAGGTYITKYLHEAYPGYAGGGGLAIDGNGRILLLNSAASHESVNIYAADGSFLYKVGEPGDGPGQFLRQNGVAVDGAGNIYVADSGHTRIQKFDSSGTFILAFGEDGEGEYQFGYPRAVAVDGDGNLYVADSQYDKITKYRPGGAGRQRGAAADQQTTRRRDQRHRERGHRRRRN